MTADEAMDQIYDLWDLWAIGEAKSRIRRYNEQVERILDAIDYEEAK